MAVLGAGLVIGGVALNEYRAPTPQQTNELAQSYTPSTGKHACDSDSPSMSERALLTKQCENNILVMSKGHDLFLRTAPKLDWELLPVSKDFDAMIATLFIESHMNTRTIRYKNGKPVKYQEHIGGLQYGLTAYLANMSDKLRYLNAVKDEVPELKNIKGKITEKIYRSKSKEWRKDLFIITQLKKVDQRITARNLSIAYKNYNQMTVFEMACVDYYFHNLPVVVPAMINKRDSAKSIASLVPEAKPYIDDNADLYMGGEATPSQLFQIFENWTRDAITTFGSGQSLREYKNASSSANRPTANKTMLQLFGLG